MKAKYGVEGIVAAALCLAVYLTIPPVVWATQTQDSLEINKHLAEAKAEAVQLKADAEQLEAFTKSKVSWQSHAQQLEMIKEHVNNAGKVLTELQADEGTGSPWQQTAIKRIEPLLRELAANVGATINHLNENQNKVHMQEYMDYANANYALAADLEELIRTYVNYGQARQKF